jgi:seryl-tRNA synthetase
LNIRVKRKDGSVELLHSLNGTAAAMARTLVAIMDNFQRNDDKLAIPKVLQPYMNGREVL